MRSIYLFALFAWVLVPFLSAEDWPQWRGVHRDARIDDPRIVKSLPQKKIPRLWTAPVGAGYSGPTVAGGRVYLTDRQGEEPEVQERVLCFDAASGDLLWNVAYPVDYTIDYRASGPRASVTVDDGKAYAVGAMGMVHCLDAVTGDVLWKKDPADHYDLDLPIWGITTAPLIYRDLVIQVVAGKDNACIVAFDRTTGQESWRALNERAGYSAPILIRQGDQDVVVCWTGESVTGLDPQSGDVFWSIPVLPRNMPIGVPTPAVQDDNLFVASFYDGSMLIRLDQTKPAAEKRWHRIGIDEKNTDALHCMISGPIIKGDAIYGFDSYGELRCLDLATGDRVWEDLSVVPKNRWATVHTIRNGDSEIMLNDQGELLLVDLSRDGVKVMSRSQLLKPTKKQLSRRDGVVWSHPAIADGMIYARNDEELICASLMKEPSPKISFWYGDHQRFGHLGGHPQRWINVLGTVTPAESIKSVSFRLGEGRSRELSFQEDKRRIAKDGDFNVEIDRSDLKPGKNLVVVSAVTQDGDEIRRSVQIDYQADGPGWPLPYSIDWSEASRIEDVAQVVDGFWKLTSDGVRSVRRYYDRVLAFGDQSWRDYEVATTVTVHALTSPQADPNQTAVTHAAIALRWPGHDPDGRQPTVKWHPLGATAEFRLGGDLQQCRWRIFDGQKSGYVESDHRRVLQFETPYAMKHRVETLADGTSRYRVKLWPAGKPEPVAWDLERLEFNDNVPTGSALLLAHHSDVTFGDVSVVPISDQR